MAFDYSGLTLGLAGAAGAQVDSLLGASTRPGEGGTPGAVGGWLSAIAGALTPSAAASGTSQSPTPQVRPPANDPGGIPWGWIALAGAGAVLAIVVFH
jgi:hypothetical protein